MCAHSSSTKIWGWVVVQRRCLNDSIFHASAHLSPKLAARGHQIDLHRYFALVWSNEASQAVEKGCIVQENDPPVTSLPSLSGVCHIHYVNLYRK